MKKPWQRFLELEFLSIAYLALPFFIFFAGWFRPFFALNLWPLFGYLLYQLFRYYDQSSPAPQFTSDRIWGSSKWNHQKTIIVLALALWALISGVTGFYFHQNGDYQKHNAVLFDLINLSWPVSYLSGPGWSSPLYLVYYFAYYLPAAVVGKIFGLVAARIALYLWVTVGLSLSFFWFVRLCRTFRWWMLIFFILFSGMDIWGHVFMRSVDLADGVAHIEWWAQARFWTYQANTTLLWWVPQQALAAWILTALFFDFLYRQDQNQKAWPCFLFLLGTFWTLLATLGLFPLALFVVWKKGLRRMINWQDILGFFLLIIPLALFFHTSILAHFGGFIWQVYDFFKVWPKYYIFCLAEFGVLAYLIYPVIRRVETENERQFYLLVVLLLLMFPLFIWGSHNDFGMRASIPALFILQIYVARFLGAQLTEIESWIRRLVILLLIFGAMTPLSEISRNFKHADFQYPYASMSYIETDVVVQYLGDADSFFFRVFAAPTNPKVVMPPPVIEMLRRGTIDP
jgi:hypothetical protein